jgi:hypothetical protein
MGLADKDLVTIITIQKRWGKRMNTRESKSVFKKNQINTLELPSTISKIK